VITEASTAAGIGMCEIHLYLIETADKYLLIVHMFLSFRHVGLASSAILVVALHKPNRAGKWQKCNLVPCMASVGQRHGLAMSWVDRPRTSADERGVVCSPRCRDCV